MDLGDLQKGSGSSSSSRCVRLNGVFIAGAGPAGVSIAALLKEKGVPYVLVEKSDGPASLWKKYTYDPLVLQLPKKHCELPNLPIPDELPEFLTNKDFSSYVDSYVKEFGIEPKFNEEVVSAKYDDKQVHWRVVTKSTITGSETEYLVIKLVVATGENAEAWMPKIQGLEEFSGGYIHSKHYKSGKDYEGKTVLVVGSGNSGIDVSLDLSNHYATPLTVVHDDIYLDLPKLIPAHDLAMMLHNYNPSQFSNRHGRAPTINAFPAIKKFNSDSVDFVDGVTRPIDAIVFATGYRTNVPDWLQETDFIDEYGYPKGWKGERGIYAAGFTRQGLVGVHNDAVNICEDIYLKYSARKTPMGWISGLVKYFVKYFSDVTAW